MVQQLRRAGTVAKDMLSNNVQHCCVVMILASTYYKVGSKQSHVPATSASTDRLDLKPMI